MRTLQQIKKTNMEKSNNRYKFRAWDKVENKMLSWELICINWSCGALKDNFHHVVMQFTGLRDKNGKEIYEGDIVRDDSKDNGADFGASLRCGNYEVTWSEENCCFSLDGYYMQISKTQAKRLEVIGNIYQNPELLK